MVSIFMFFYKINTFFVGRIYENISRTCLAADRDYRRLFTRITAV
jgi:hypothetical protein